MVHVIFSQNKINISAFRMLSWSNIGDGQESVQVETFLERDRRRFLGREIEQLVSDLRDNFIDYVGYSSEFQNNKVLWYSARVASKSIFQMNMFHQYVYLKLIESYADRGVEHLFVVNDPELWLNLKNTRFPKIRMHGNLSPRFLFRELREKVDGELQFFRYFFLWLFFKLFLPSPSLLNGNVMLHSFIDKRVFSRLPEYNDAYFGELEIFLKKNKYRVLRITPILVGVRSVFKLRQYFNNIILLLSCLKLSDFFRVFSTAMRINCMLSEGNMIKDKELLGSLLKKEEKKENASKAYQLNLFYYHAFCNLAKKFPSGASIIYTFENQPWEKMLNLAFGSGFKKVAYQHTHIPINFLEYQISAFEKNMPLPDTILASGKNWLNFLRNYYGGHPLADAGALRLDYIFASPTTRDKKQNNNIVAALPIFPGIALALQKHILDCLSCAAFNKYNFIVKAHPCLIREAILSEKLSQYNNCEVTDRGLNELLKNCSLMITTSSTAAFEALSFGVKTLYFIPETVSIGSEHFIRQYLTLAYSDNFMERLLYCVETKTAIDKFNIRDFFSEPDYAAFLVHL